MLARVVELICESDQKFRSARIKRVDGSVETHSLGHLYPLELSLTHNHFPDTPANEDNSVPSRGRREANSMESTNKVTNIKSERKKKSTPDPEYLYY